MRALWQRGIWWLYKHIFHVHRIGCVDFIDIRLGGDARAARQVIREALNYVEHAGKGFNELVAAELNLIAATAHQRERVSPHVGLYSAPFAGHELTNGFFLACRLVWAASYIRHYRSAMKNGIDMDEHDLRELSNAEEVEFVRQFPDSLDWLNYVDARS